jgi:hypothetical protein
MPATRPEKLPPIDVGAWVRVGGRIQGRDPKKLDDQSLDTAYGELHAGGKIHKNVSVTVNLNFDALAALSKSSTGSAAVGVEDAIIGFDFAEPFHLWAGHLLVTVDRSNLAGPFFMVPWNYPGFLTVGSTQVVGAPYEGPSGRNNGMVVWGDFAEGMFKYMAGAFNLGDVTQTPLYSGRLNLALMDKEPGFWGNASYFGEKNILSVGVGAQFQREGSTPPPAVPPAMTPAPDDYSEVNADALMELKVPGGGWVTGEAAYYHFSGAFNAVKDSFFVTAAYASPEVGIGNIQPMVRYQMAKGDGVKAWNIDAFLSYLIKGPALRATVGFQHVDLDNDVTGNAIQLGAQAIFF